MNDWVIRYVVAVVDIPFDLVDSSNLGYLPIMYGFVLFGPYPFLIFVFFLFFSDSDLGIFFDVVTFMPNNWLQTAAHLTTTSGIWGASTACTTRSSINTWCFCCLRFASFLLSLIINRNTFALIRLLILNDKYVRHCVCFGSTLLYSTPLPLLYNGMASNIHL